MRISIDHPGRIAPRPVPDPAAAGRPRGDAPPPPTAGSARARIPPNGYAARIGDRVPRASRTRAPPAPAAYTGLSAGARGRGPPPQAPARFIDFLLF